MPFSLRPQGRNQPSRRGNPTQFPSDLGCL